MRWLFTSSLPSVHVTFWLLRSTSKGTYIRVFKSFIVVIQFVYILFIGAWELKLDELVLSVFFSSEDQCVRTCSVFDLLRGARSPRRLADSLRSFAHCSTSGLRSSSCIRLAQCCVNVGMGYRALLEDYDTEGGYYVRAFAHRSALRLATRPLSSSHRLGPDSFWSAVCGKGHELVIMIKV
jgi:hypothetical protein